MKKSRRNELNKVQDRITALKKKIEEALAPLYTEAEEIENELESIQEAHQEEFDSRSEKWQESEKGQEHDVENTLLGSIVESFSAFKEDLNDEDLNFNLDQVFEQIEEAKGPAD